MVEIFQVDAFASRPFAGNPAAVCVLAGAVDARWMQSLAGEMNLSETAFLWPEGDGHRLRWFTPATEVELCGHATLAAAHVLWESGALARHHDALFETLGGRLTARRGGDLIRLDFPALRGETVAPPPALEAALGVAVLAASRGRFDLLVEVDDGAAVRRLAPDYRALSGLDCRGVIVTARGDGTHDFVSRYFAPACGIDEDPVTGSAHCQLAPYWAERLGKRTMVGHQASARGGDVRVRMRGDRVELAGRAVTVWRGRLTDDALAGS